MPDPKAAELGHSEEPRQQSAKPVTTCLVAADAQNFRVSRPRASLKATDGKILRRQSDRASRWLQRKDTAYSTAFTGKAELAFPQDEPV